MAVIKAKKPKFPPIYQWSFKLVAMLIVFLVLILAYLAYNNFTIKQSEQLQLLKNEEETLKADFLNKSKQIKSVPLYEQKIPALLMLESSVNQQFPATDELPNLIIQINQLAEDVNVSISSFTPINQEDSLKPTASGVKNVKITYKSFNINLSANYLDFVKLLYSLETILVILRTEEVVCLTIR